MADIALFLVMLQAAGTFIGAFFAVRGEIAYIGAMHDGNIDDAEKKHLDHLASGLWYGMTLVMASSAGLVLIAYKLGGEIQPAETSSYWSFIALVLVVTLATWALSRSHLSFSFGSAAALTGWWFLLYLAVGKLPAVTFGATAALFIVATILFWGLLHYLRGVLAPREGSEAPQTT